MFILFEKLVKNPELTENMSREQSVILDGLFDYIEGRLMPFKDDMEQIELQEVYELQNGGREKLSSFVWVHFPSPGISIYGYTDDLRDKMTSSFSQTDIDPLWQKITDSLRIFLN